MDPIVIFLPFIFVLGIITSYEDVKHGKIRNRYIVAALICVIIGYSLLLLNLYINHEQINYSYLYDLGLNFLIACITGYALWAIKLWSAADGKLFAAYSALVPLTAYSNTYYKFFPSIILLINTFVPFFACSLVKLVFFTKIGEKKEALKNISKKNLLLSISALFWISWIFKFPTLFGIKIDSLLKVLIVIMLFFVLERILKKEGLLTVSAIMCALRLIVDYQYVFSAEFLKKFIPLLLLMLSILFIRRIAFFVYTRTTRIKELKEGMILAEMIYRAKKSRKYERATAEELECVQSSNYELIVLESPAEGLTKQDIETLRKLYKSGKLKFNEIKIQQTLPFAPFMFLGVLLTVLLRGIFWLIINFIQTPKT